VTDSNNSNRYSALGAHPVINAAGSLTAWGGSNPSADVLQAMEGGNVAFIEMRELLEKTGEHIARTLDVEAAYVTAGCYTALVLSTAACVTGKDPEKRDRIPDTSGMKNEILIQKKHRYSYDRAYTIPGTRLIEVGDEEGTTSDQLDQAIGEDTAAVVFLIKSDPNPECVTLEETLKIAHSKGVPVIADAAAQIYPLERFRENARSADLVCFGGKYFQAPQSTGLLCGKKELVEAAIDHGFIGPRPFGRGMKVDRQEVLGFVAAFDGWLSMDHDTRLDGYKQKYNVILTRLEGIPTLKEMKIVSNNSFWAVGLHMVLDRDVIKKDANQIAEELLNGTPRVKVSTSGKDTIVINAHNLSDGDETALADRLRVVLSG
jgi:L-seryl-tRNA(Ser) seleniumtransferase